MSHQPTGSEARRKAQTRAGTRRWVGAITALAAFSPAVAHADPAPKPRGFTPAPPLSALAVAPSSVRLPAPPPAPEWQTTDGVLTRGQTLSEVLRADGVSPQAINQIAQALKGHFSFRRAMPGHSFRLVRDASGTVLEFRYHLSPTQSYTVKRVGGQLVTTGEDGDLEARPTRIA